MQQVVIIPYRRFGTMYRGQRSRCVNSLTESIRVIGSSDPFKVRLCSATDPITEVEELPHVTYGLSEPKYDSRVFLTPRWLCQRTHKYNPPPRSLVTVSRQQTQSLPFCSDDITSHSPLNFVTKGLYLRMLLTYVWPCILIYFYSKTNQMHNISNLFYFGTTLYMFRRVSPSIIRSLRLYIQHHAIQVLWLLADAQYLKFILFWNNTLHVSDGLSVRHQDSETVYTASGICTVLGSWWWTDRPSETCRMLFQNKMNLRYCESDWFYYRNIALLLLLLLLKTAATTTKYSEVNPCLEHNIGLEPLINITRTLLA